MIVVSSANIILNFWFSVFFSCDRAHRRYYKLDSIPGLIVQDEELNPGPCLDEIVPQNPALIDAGDKETLLHLREVYEEMNSSDKENSSKDKKKNGLKSKLLMDPAEISDLNMCVSNAKTCRIHSKSIKKDAWYFYDTQEKIEEILKTLNKRGYRERSLLLNIESNMGDIMKMIGKTPKSMLNPAFDVKDDTRRKAAKKYDANLGYSLETPPCENLHVLLTDYILEIEEKIHAGSLGSLKIKDRKSWRQSLQDRNYDDFDTTLVKPENGVLPVVDKIKSEGMQLHNK